MLGGELLAALAPVVACLDKLQCRYLIGGSVASSAYGAVRATYDVDLAASFPLILAPAFVAALDADFYVDLGAIQYAAKTFGSFNLVHFASAIKIDVFCVRGRPYDIMAFDRATHQILDPKRSDLLFKLASPEDVVLTKLVWYLKGNCQSEQQLKDIRSVFRVQKDLDTEYLRKWAPALEVVELLERTMSEIQTP